MDNDKGFVYLIQPAELIGTSRYKIGYSRNNDLYKFRKEYKKGSRFLDIYESEYSPSLVREIRQNFNNKFKLVAGRTYYEGNETEIKNNFNTIINSTSLSSINRPKLVSNKELPNINLPNEDRKIVLYSNNSNYSNYSNYSNNSNNKYDLSSHTFSKALFDRAKQSRKHMTNDCMANYTYMHNIMYGQNSQDKNIDKSY